MRSKGVLVCLLGCILGIGRPVLAVPINFDLTVASEDFHFVEGSVSLQVAAATGAGAPASVTQTTTSGLGVSASASDSNMLDGSGGLDLLQLIFSRPVGLLEVVFSWVGDSDEFSLAVDSTSVIEDEYARGLFDFSPYQLMGEVFDFSATDPGDSYRLKSLTVDAPVLAPPPAPVPEPATWLLMSAGLLGLACWRRQR